MKELEAAKQLPAVQQRVQQVISDERAEYAEAQKGAFAPSSPPTEPAQPETDSEYDPKSDLVTSDTIEDTEKDPVAVAAEIQS